MHHFHFRYVAECPAGQTCARVFQLINDLNPAHVDILFRDAFIAFQTGQNLSELPEGSLNRWKEFQAYFRRSVESLPQECASVFGMVCFVLGTANDRLFRRLPHLIRMQREHAELQGEQSESEVLLLREQHMLQIAYDAFCELVISPLCDSKEDSFA